MTDSDTQQIKKPPKIAETITKKRPEDYQTLLKNPTCFTTYALVQRNHRETYVLSQGPIATFHRIAGVVELLREF